MQKFEPMTVGQILDSSFRLYKRNFTRFITIIAIVQVPLSLLNILSTQYFFRGQPFSAEDPLAVPMMPFAAFLIPTFLAVIATTLSNAALLKSISGSYLGKDVSVGDAYSFVFPKIWTLIWASILVGLVIMVGLMLFVVPGIIFMFWFILTTQAIVIEDIKARRGMSRSKSLVSGNLNKVFLLSLIIIVISIIVNFITGFIPGLFGPFLKESFTAFIVIRQLSSLVGTVLITPVWAAAFILLYYDLRIRKEGFDLEMLAQRLGVKNRSADAGGSAL